MTTVMERALTPEQIEGPYWFPGSPQRTDLAEGGAVGAPLTLIGQVFAHDLTPIEGAWLDFWQCDGRGVDDERGYTLRGHQFTDARGSYRVETVVPVEYTDVLELRGHQINVRRTAHIHVKVKKPSRPTLTTQLYFPEAPHNAADGIFRPECLIDLAPDGRTARFDFVLQW